MNKFLKHWLPIIAAVGLLCLVLRQVSFREILQQFKGADYVYIALSGLITTSSYYLRGARWRQPLIALGYNPSAFKCTVSILSGNVASMIVVGSGEFTRCLTLQKTQNVPIAQGSGSVIAERVIDFVMLVLVLLVTFSLEVTKMRPFLASMVVKLDNKLFLFLVPCLW